MTEVVGATQSQPSVIVTLVHGGKNGLQHANFLVAAEIQWLHSTGTPNANKRVYVHPQARFWRVFWGVPILTEDVSEVYQNRLFSAENKVFS